MIIDREKIKGEWHELDKETSFKVRPFPLSKVKVNDEDATAWFHFNYCLVDWSGLSDETGKELVCNEKNKLLVFDYNAEILNFVTKIITQQFAAFSDAEKN